MRNMVVIQGKWFHYNGSRGYKGYTTNCTVGYIPSGYRPTKTVTAPIVAYGDGYILVPGFASVTAASGRINRVFLGGSSNIGSCYHSNMSITYKI